jgi:hypothetical protein
LAILPVAIVSRHFRHSIVDLSGRQFFRFLEGGALYSDFRRAMGRNLNAVFQDAHLLGLWKPFIVALT